MIEVDGVVKRLGERVVLDHISFVAPAGTVTGLLGPNGAGKTTTMRLVATLLRPDEGTIRIAGVDVVTQPVEARRRIGLVTEEPGLLDRLTVREQLGFNAEAYGLSPRRARERIEALAEVLGFVDLLDQRAAVLSKGNRQKVSLCRALVHDPPVLLLDEPTSGLDVVAAAGLEDLLREHDLTGDRTVLLSTHRLDEVERMATKVVGIADGRVVVDATPDELVADAGAETFRDAFVRVLGAAALGGAG
jgi:ABC-type multidrug transport system ATPase subunit